MRTIAIIPARGGSKGVPRKNLLPLCGKPLIAWSIEQALAAELVDTVYVTTDCKEIAYVAMQCGAEVINEPAEFATDLAKTEDALLHALHATKEDADYVVLLQPTSPIRQPGSIDEAIRTCVEASADSLFSARHIEGFTWQEGIGRWIPQYQTRNRPMRQARMSQQVEENGSIYVFRPWVLGEYQSRLGGEVACYLMHPLDSFQLDAPEDVELLESLLPVRLAQPIDRIRQQYFSNPGAVLYELFYDDKGAHAATAYKWQGGEIVCISKEAMECGMMVRFPWQFEVLGIDPLSGHTYARRIGENANLQRIEVDARDLLTNP